MKRKITLKTPEIQNLMSKKKGKRQIKKSSFCLWINVQNFSRRQIKSSYIAKTLINVKDILKTQTEILQNYAKNGKREMILTTKRKIVEIFLSLQNNLKVLAGIFKIKNSCFGSF